MDNAQKAIMIGVGLFITIIIISAVMLITSAGQDLINNSTTQVGNISSSLQAQVTSQFDETVLNGSQVISAVKSYYTTDNFIIVVDNGSGAQNYGKSTTSETLKTDASTVLQNAPASNSSPISVGKLSDASNSAYYVASTAKYKAHLIKRSNSVVGIYFKAQ